VEAQILEAIEVDYIDESEVLTMADEENHINKNNFNVRSVGDDVINEMMSCLPQLLSSPSYIQ